MAKSTNYSNYSCWKPQMLPGKESGAGFKLCRSERRWAQQTNTKYEAWGKRAKDHRIICLTFERCFQPPVPCYDYGVTFWLITVEHCWTQIRTNDIKYQKCFLSKVWQRELPSLGPSKSSKSCKLSLQPEPETSGGSNQSSCKWPKQGKRLHVAMEKLEFRKLLYWIVSGQVATAQFNQFHAIMKSYEIFTCHPPTNPPLNPKQKPKYYYLTMCSLLHKYIQIHQNHRCCWCSIKEMGHAWQLLIQP